MKPPHTILLIKLPALLAIRMNPRLLPTGRRQGARITRLRVRILVRLVLRGRVGTLRVEGFDVFIAALLQGGARRKLVDVVANKLGFAGGDAREVGGAGLRLSVS
jgi:hypothetical protein